MDLYKKIKNIFSKKPLLIEPKPQKYDEGVNTVVMKKENFESLRVNADKMNKKTKLDNGFISVYDLTDEEIEEMIQLYNEELKEVKRKIAATKLEIERIQKENKNGG